MLMTTEAKTSKAYETHVACDISDDKNDIPQNLPVKKSQIKNTKLKIADYFL